MGPGGIETLSAEEPLLDGWREDGALGDLLAWRELKQLWGRAQVGKSWCKTSWGLWKD